MYDKLDSAIETLSKFKIHYYSATVFYVLVMTTFAPVITKSIFYKCSFGFVNNTAEQSIRGFCIGKKNWVMCDTINGAEASAIIYSLVETAKANKLKIYEYFTHMLTEIPEHM